MTISTRCGRMCLQMSACLRNIALESHCLNQAAALSSFPLTLAAGLIAQPAMSAYRSQAQPVRAPSRQGVEVSHG